MAKKTEIIVVLDRSGSMERIRKETMEGFNRFVLEQQATEGEACMTLVQFDNFYEVNYEGMDVHEVRPLDARTYKPRGATALLDAIGQAPRDFRKRVTKTEVAAEGLQVVFVIITDGRENDSKMYSREKIFKMIKKAEEKWGWQYVYLGANQDAIEEASHIGIMEGKAMTFVADKFGTQNMFVDLSINIQEMRVNESAFSFKEEQRKKQER